MKKIIFIMLIFIMIPGIWSEAAFAQEYRIGPEDVLSITFWQQPQLNTNARVSQDGSIALPVIGTITVAGLTPTELARKIVERISLFNKNISQASVVVDQYGSKKVYVNGHVRQPGKFTFEVIPDLWKIILEAGGPDENARLDQVKIIRGGKEAGKTISVDLEKLLAEGDLTKLPSIYPDDTININGVNIDARGSEPAPTGGVTTTQVSSDVVYIYGQVVRPGGYQFTRNLTLLEAIVIAGGPTPIARMDRVNIIMKGDPYSSVVTINLEDYARKGTPSPFLLNPGDIIFIPQQKNSFAQMLQQGIFAEIIRIVLTAGTSILIFSLAR